MPEPTSPRAQAAHELVGHDDGVDLLIAAGLGLEYGTVRLDRTTDAWIAAGAELRHLVAHCLAGLVADVEQIGSSAVRGLLAKPIVDLAAGLSIDDALPEVRARLEAAGWIYRGNAGDEGGHVFVLEARTGLRIAHLHVVAHDGTQWRNYLRFRDLLRTSSSARDDYEATKRRLAAAHPDDRTAYTDGKTDVVQALLDRGRPHG
jgi:GrpB-like predicted nucleotidyltransferase (UPF0157 family)